MKSKLTAQAVLVCLICTATAVAQPPAPPAPAPPPLPPGYTADEAGAPAPPPMPPGYITDEAMAQVHAAQAQAEVAESQVELAVADGMASRSGDVFVGGFGGNRRATPLLIAADDLKDPKQRDALVEDLNVMHRILTKAASSVAGGARQPTAMGIAVFAGAQPGPDTLYLSGFGPVFLLDVKFPLLGPPHDEAEKPAEPKPKDSTWEETKRELYGQPQPRGGGMPDVMMERYGIMRGTPGGERPAFDAGRVEALKVALLKALKNAGNIHELKPDDTLVVVVRGGATGKKTRTISNDELQRELPSGSEVRGTGYFTTYTAPNSTLTLRVKAADIRAFAGDKLSLEEFTKQASITIY